MNFTLQKAGTLLGNRCNFPEFFAPNLAYGVRRQPACLVVATVTAPSCI